MRSRVFILSLILLFPALAGPMALATTSQYKPRGNVPGDMCYATRVGSFYASDLFIPVKKAGQDIFTGLVFPNVTLASYTYVAQANLTLHFTLDFSAGSNETITIYGYEDYLEAGTFESSAQLIYGPLTSTHLNIDVSTITGPGFYQFNVTALVNELLAHGWWTPGASLAFVIYAAGETITRYISSNEWTPSQYPVLDLKYDIPPGSPEPWLNFNQTYNGYDIFDGHIGFRSLIFRDHVNGTHFILNYDYLWSEYLDQYYIEATSRYTLPEPTDIWNGGWPGYSIRNNYINVGMDLWLLTDPGAARQVNLWKSSDKGASWDIMHRFNYTGTTNYPTAYTMTYNPALNRIHILIRRTVGLDVSYCYYDIETDTGSTLTTIMTTEYNLSTIEIVCDYETDHLYVAATGGASTSGQYMHFLQRISGAWSSKYISDNPSNYAISHTQLQWSQQNKRLVAVSMFSGTTVQFVGLYQKGETYDDWPAWNEYFVMSLTSDLGNGMTSVMNELYPEDLKIDMIGVQYRRLDRWYKSISSYPYSSKDLYDPFGLSPETDFYAGTIYLGPLPSISGMGIQADRKYFCSLEVDHDEYEIFEVFEPGGFGLPLGIARHRLYTHDHEIRLITSPKDPFGPYGVYIYLDGGFIKYVPTIDDALDYIDGLDPDPEDPSPPGWPEEGPLTRFRVTLYMLILGLGLVIVPPIFMAAKKDLTLMAPVIFCMFIGVMLLVYLRYI